ncbi:uncharacterized protein LOC141853133 isoform X2 [Brevipalpus obovatus]|uniref:uncharacterized protein LOC141853133 isoform X2 n=1 Tax=Brevipalpus obovatus TaxID=246614 RepID=UPI003D9E2CB3
MCNLPSSCDIIFISISLLYFSSFAVTKSSTEKHGNNSNLQAAQSFAVPIIIDAPKSYSKEKSFDSSKQESSNEAANSIGKRFSFSASMFESFLDSKASLKKKDEISLASPLSVSIAMRLQPKRRYHKLRIASIPNDDNSNGSLSPLKSVNISEPVSFILKRAGQLSDVPKQTGGQMTRKPRNKNNYHSQQQRQQQQSASSSTVKQQSALARVEIARQKSGLQSSGQHSVLPVSTPSDISINKGSNELANRNRKLSKHHIALTGPPSSSMSAKIISKKEQKQLAAASSPTSSWSERKKKNQAINVVNNNSVERMVKHDRNRGRTVATSTSTTSTTTTTTTTRLPITVATVATTIESQTVPTELEWYKHPDPPKPTKLPIKNSSKNLGNHGTILMSDYEADLNPSEPEMMVNSNNRYTTQRPVIRTTTISSTVYRQNQQYQRPSNLTRSGKHSNGRDQNMGKSERNRFNAEVLYHAGSKESERSTTYQEMASDTSEVRSTASNRISESDGMLDKRYKKIGGNRSNQRISMYNSATISTTTPMQPHQFGGDSDVITEQNVEFGVRTKPLANGGESNEKKNQENEVHGNGINPQSSDRTRQGSKFFWSTDSRDHHHQGQNDVASKSNVHRPSPISEMTTTSGYKYIYNHNDQGDQYDESSTETIDPETSTTVKVSKGYTQEELASFGTKITKQFEDQSFASTLAPRHYQTRRIAGRKSTSTSTTTSTANPVTESNNEEWETSINNQYQKPIQREVSTVIYNKPLSGLKEIIYEEFHKNYHHHVPINQNQKSNDHEKMSTNDNIGADSVNEDSPYERPEDKLSSNSDDHSDNSKRNRKDSEPSEYLFPIDVSHLDKHCNRNKTSPISSASNKNSAITNRHDHHHNRHHAHGRNHHGGDQNHGTSRQDENIFANSDRDEEHLSFGDRRTDRKNRNFNMRKVAYQYKPLPPTTTPMSPQYDSESDSSAKIEYESVTEVATSGYGDYDQSTTPAYQDPTNSLDYDTTKRSHDLYTPNYGQDHARHQHQHHHNSNRNNNNNNDITNQPKFFTERPPNQPATYSDPANYVNEYDEEYPYTNREMDKNYDQTMAVTDTTHQYRDETDNNGKRNTLADDKAVFDNFGLEAMEPRTRPLKSKNRDTFAHRDHHNRRESTIQYDQRSLPDSSVHSHRPNYHLHHHHEQRVSPHSRDETRVTPPMSPDYGSDSSDSLDTFGELAGIPGNAGKDYPTLSKLPETISFSCQDRTSGFYADPTHRCQVYHHCNQGTIQSFLCPNGTVFNQEIFVCNWWFNVDCDRSEHLYHLNEKLERMQATSTTTTTTTTTEGPMLEKSTLWKQKPYSKSTRPHYYDIHSSEPEYTNHYDYRETPTYYSNYEINDQYDSRPRDHDHDHPYHRQTTLPHHTSSSPSSSSSLSPYSQYSHYKKNISHNKNRNFVTNRRSYDHDDYNHPSSLFPYY